MTPDKSLALLAQELEEAVECALAHDLVPMHSPDEARRGHLCRRCGRLWNLQGRDLGRMALDLPEPPESWGAA